jgi:hypothetical protein
MFDKKKIEHKKTNAFLIKTIISFYFLYMKHPPKGPMYWGHGPSAILLFWEVGEMLESDRNMSTG